MQERAPRNIRDIAHLYISRPRRGARRLAVVAADRGCFPGLHVANLALALTMDGHRSRVVERSGLVMNAACFLALPPEVYAAAPSRRPSGGVRAAGGVDVWFADALPSTAPGGDPVELVHGPPMDRGADLDGFLKNCDVADVVIIAHSSDAVRVSGDGRRLWLLQLGPGKPDTSAGQLLLAGRIERWERSLPDAMPAVLRDPESMLARQYREAARRIILQHHEWRDHADTGRPDPRSCRVRSTPADR